MIQLSNTPDANKSKIEELIQAGKAKGALTYKEIMNQLVEMEIEPDQFDKILDTLESMGVRVVNGEDAQAEVAEPVEEIDISVPEGVGIDDPVRMYLKEIGKVPLLSPDEEIEIAKRMEAGDAQAKRMEAGDAQAKRKLAEANLRLVVSIAKRYVGRGMLFLDMI